MVSFLSMGIFSRKPQVVQAQEAPQIMADGFYGYNNYFPALVSRQMALGVPAIKRCRDLISGTLASVPLEYYKKSTGEKIAAPRWVEQPSKHQPLYETLYFTLDSLLMYGQAFWQITEVYAEDGRMARANWVANTKVGFITDPATNFITEYNIDGKPVPMSGLGSLITFQKDEGILGIGARTIQAALDVQRAAAVAAATPMSSGIIKNSGADLPPTEVSALLAAWKRSRQNNSTAYLTSTLNYEPTSFSPKDMLYNEAIQNLATECARLCSVDPYYVSASQNTTMTYANVQDERKQLISLALQPYITAIETRLSMDDITNSQNYVRFAVDETFLRADTMERLTAIEKMISLGLITVEQAQELEDLSPNGTNS